MKKKNDTSNILTKEYLDTSIDGLKDEFSGLKDEFSGLKDEFSGLKDDFSGLKDDFSGLKDDFSSLRGDFVVFKKEIREDVDASISRALDKLYSRIDPLLAEIDDNRVDRVITTEKIENHEKRISKLERN